MKNQIRNFLAAGLVAFALHASAQVDTVIHTSGRYILGPCGDTLTLRGINYAPYNWGYSSGSLNIGEIAQTGANVVRLSWYASSNAPVYSDLVALDSALSKCVQHKLIAILELHDYTCADSPSGLSTLTNWWTQPAVVAILTRYKHSVIVNYANESLYVNWANNSTTALATYKSTYISIIQTLRNTAGFNFPILIDAPDCGQNSDAFITTNTASDIIAADPQHNVIFSAHAYWFGFANNDSTQMAAKINAVLAQQIPFVLGEVANQQDDQISCQYNLNYQPLLNYCQSVNMHWIAWGWDNDVCPARQISSTGNFSNLTAYGNVIVNDPVFGLLTNSPAKSDYLMNNGCGSWLGTNENQINAGIRVYPVPSGGNVSVTVAKKQTAYLYNAMGAQVGTYALIPGVNEIDLNDQADGVYWMKTETGTVKIVISHL